MKLKINKKALMMIGLSSFTLCNTTIANSENVKNDDYKKMVTATTAVNIRTNPNLESPIIDVLQQGNSLEEIDHIDGWYKVKYNDFYGYVSDWYSYENTIINKQLKKVVYVTSECNMRDENNNYISELSYLDSCEVYEEKENDYLVKANDKIGYIPKANTCNLSYTSVVVDISDQYLKLYEGSNILLESYVVTGKDSTPSDIGLFCIYDKSTNTTLFGDNYQSYVNYWMPYNEGEGLHDADGWRSYYGGEDYHDYGSHGCINLPYNTAQKIYEKVKIGDNVLVHN